MTFLFLMVFGIVLALSNIFALSFLLDDAFGFTVMQTTAIYIVGYAFVQMNKSPKFDTVQQAVYVKLFEALLVWAAVGSYFLIF